MLRRRSRDTVCDMGDEKWAAIAGVFTRHGVTELWVIYDEAYPSEAVFLVNDAEYERARGDRELRREVAALLPDTKLGVIPYTEAKSRRLLPRAGGDAAS